MPASKKKPTTPPSDGSTPESPSSIMREQEAFRQHIRRLAQGNRI